MSQQVMKHATADALAAPALDYILLDGSGSMRDKWWDMLAALEVFVDTLKRENINSHGILHIFDDHDLEYIAHNDVLAKWPSFRTDPPGAHWGGTPLYDAINLMGRNLRDRKPDRCSIVIATDGDESSSTHTSVHEARAILDWCRAQGWTVTFIGCDFDNTRTAKLLGANASNSLGVQKRKLLEAGKLLGDKRIRYARGADDIEFTDEECKKFGGYLTGPSGK